MTLAAACSSFLRTPGDSFVLAMAKKGCISAICGVLGIVRHCKPEAASGRLQDLQFTLDQSQEDSEYRTIAGTRFRSQSNPEGDARKRSL